ncbi:hypothetical protein N7452_011047 [Penicillium brevicompactum]|uniref:Uncharacterized protein n=1 Tax=Penicillium brevicompactum TaxID=5074 RepID=A0A9W9U7L8_PENBR|nr:hypothetical protein N7452_011047 [Penicillium brevicompactum]
MGHGASMNQSARQQNQDVQIPDQTDLRISTEEAMASPVDTPGEHLPSFAHRCDLSIRGRDALDDFPWL